MPAYMVSSIFVIPFLVGCSSPSQALARAPAARDAGAGDAGLAAAGKDGALAEAAEEAAAAAAPGAWPGRPGAAGAGGEKPGPAPGYAAEPWAGEAGEAGAAWGEAAITLLSFLTVLGIGLWLERCRPVKRAAPVPAAKLAARKARGCGPPPARAPAAAAKGQTAPAPAARAEWGLQRGRGGRAVAAVREGGGGGSGAFRGPAAASGSRTRGAGAAEERRCVAEGGDVLAAAVRGGQAGDLPRLLDRARALVEKEGLAAAEVAAVLAKQLLSALRACASQHCFREALAAYDRVAGHIGEGCGGVWSLLLYSAVAAGEFQRCEAFFERLCRFSDPSGHDFLNMVRYFVQGQDMNGLCSMLEDLEEHGVQVDGLSWNRALGACAAAGALDLAEALVASSTRQGAMDAVAYNTLMRGYVRSNSTGRCFECYEEMQARGVQPTDVTFGVLLEACHEASDFARAREVFEDLRRRGLRPNVVHCTAFMKCLTGEGRLDDAEQVLRWMLRSSGAPPDLVAYSMLVKARAEHGDVRGALRVLQEMLGRGIQPDALVLNSALSGCCAARVAPEEIQRVLRWLMDQGLRPSTTTLSILVKALAGRQAWDEALQLLAEAPAKLGVWPEARIYAQLAQACAKANAGSKVVQTYAAMVEAAARQGVRIGRPASSRLSALCGACGAAAAAAAQQINHIVQKAEYLVQPGCVDVFLGPAA